MSRSYFGSVVYLFDVFEQTKNLSSSCLLLKLKEIIVVVLTLFFCWHLCVCKLSINFIVFFSIQLSTYMYLLYPWTMAKLVLRISVLRECETLKVNRKCIYISHFCDSSVINIVRLAPLELLYVELPKFT